MFNIIKSDAVNDAYPNWKHFLLFFILFFSTQMDFRGSDLVVGGHVDIQVIIRLLILAGVLVVSLPHVNVFINHVRQLPIFFHILYLVYLVLVSSNFETVNFYSYYAIATHFAVFFIIVIMVSRYGIDNMVYYYLIGAVIFGVISLVYYYFIPEVGRYIYWQDGALFQSSRLKGVGGHPNTVGFMMAIAALAFVHLMLQKYPVNKMLYLGVVIILFCLILTNSRTSMVGMMLMVSLYSSLYFRLFPVAVITGVVCIFFALISIGLSWGVIPELLQMVSRSGDINEITSLTGRSHIWEQLFILIQQKPILGWGHAVLGEVLVAHANEIGFTIGQAHNLYLNILFSGGFIGLFIFLLGIVSMLIFSIVKAIYKRAFLELCIVVYVLLNGMTEAIIMGSVATNSYLVFIMCIASLSVFTKQARDKVK